MVKGEGITVFEAMTAPRETIIEEFGRIWCALCAEAEGVIAGLWDGVLQLQLVLLVGNVVRLRANDVVQVEVEIGLEGGARVEEREGGCEEGFALDGGGGGGSEDRLPWQRCLEREVGCTLDATVVLGGAGGDIVGESAVG